MDPGQNVLHDSQQFESGQERSRDSLFLSLPLHQRLEVLRLLNASLGRGASSRVASLDALAAAYLQRQAGPRSAAAVEGTLEAAEAALASAGREAGRQPAAFRSEEVQILERHGVLHEVVKRRLVASLIRTVSLDMDAQEEALQQSGAAMDEQERQERMDDLRLRFWIETTYQDYLERWFLRHRQDLETWIFSCLRVAEESLASELYLQLTDDGADSAVLTDRHGIGKERWTRGVVGPVRASQVAAPLRQALAGMAAGAIHPPLAVEEGWVILQLLHRFPAEPDGEWRHDVLWSMFEADLEANADRLCDRISGGEDVGLEAGLNELSWQHEEGEAQLQPGLP